MRDPTWILAVATMALAAVTTVLAVATVWLAVEARKGSLRQIRVQTWLALEARLDSREIKTARRKLARQLDPYDQSKHDQITEEVLELFESIATVYNLGLLDKTLAISSFSFYANHWWEAVKAYVDHERRCRGDAASLFGEFEEFARAMRKHDPRINRESLKEFLENEKRLKTD